MKNVTVVDLFSGVGGMTHGFILEGFHVAAGIDIDKSCEYAYKTNNQVPFITRDVAELTAQALNAFYPKGCTNALIGCAPCQPFSQYRRQRSSDQWKPLYEFMRLIEEVDPDVISMENVPMLRNYPVYDEFLEKLRAQGYTDSTHIAFGPDYGIPQVRKRLVMFASKYGVIDMIEPTHTPETYPVIRDVIGELEPIKDGEVSKKDPLHRASKLSELNKKRIQHTPEGGGWRDWPSELVLECHKKETGKSYPSVYGRMSWQSQAPTITTQCFGLGNGRFGHPEQHRAISLREAALFQTFPPEYQFIDPDVDFHLIAIGRHIGNAVPVLLGRAIACSIREHLTQVKL